MNFLHLFYAASYGVSVDCPNVIQLAIGMNMDDIQPAIMTQLRSDCCASTFNPYSGNGRFQEPRYYVVCNNQHVTEINWYGLSLNGYINGSAIPSTITSFNVFGNRLTGLLPSLLPSGLQEISVSGNSLTGDLPVFPSTIRNLYLEFTGFTGNQFSGTLALTSPSKVYVRDNWITDVIISNTSQLVQCDLSNNPLLENPRLSSLPMCTTSNIYSASSLPKTQFVAFISSSSSKLAPSTSFTPKISSISNTKTAQATLSFSDPKLLNTSPSSTILKSNAVTKVDITTHYSTLNLNIQSFDLSQLSESPNYRVESISVVASYESSANSSAIPQADQENVSNTQIDEGNVYFIYFALGGLVFLCILVVLGSLIFKNPQIKSKFGRKNSFGTLNTVNTKV